MKNFRPITTLLAAVLIATVAIFNACSKQESTLNPVNEQELSPRDLAINNTIKSFRDKVSYLRENPNFKSGESYTADSALWLLEATINYSHTFPNDYYGQLITDTLYLSLATNDAGEVDMNELALKYDAMKTAISEVYHSKAIADKGLVLVNLEEISFKSDEVEIEVVAVTGERTNEPPGGFGSTAPFEEGDDWWYGEEAGKCEPPSAPGDAAIKLMEAMSNYIPDPGGSYTFITYETVSRKGGDPNVRRTNDPDPLDNYFDYYLYSDVDSILQFTEDSVLCLTAGEMNIYFNYLKYLLYTKIPDDENFPSDVEIQSVEFMLGWHDDIGEENTHYFHQGTFNFGQKLYRDPDDIAIEI